MVFLELGLDAATRLPHIHFAANTGDVMYAWKFKAQVISERMEQLENFPGR
jgi:hypothetical protein